MNWGLVADVLRVCGGWFGLEKPGFYGDFGLVVNVWEKNPVSCLVIGGSSFYVSALIICIPPFFLSTFFNLLAHFYKQILA